MSQKSEVFSAGGSPQPEARRENLRLGRGRDWIELAVVYGLILCALWTPQGPLNAFFSITAASGVVAFAVAGRWPSLELGLARPLAGAGYILLVGALLCGAIALAGIPLRSAGGGYAVPLSRSWQYVVWALAQEFILQGIFFLRLESLLGSRRAVVTAAAMFASAHIPSPVLTGLSLLGGVVFCELFRRWRNLYPLGIVHGALGLTIAASLPDHWLHHMRVGIGFLRFH
jgi:Type II CAAX prenyl endopeptidase Rce1-like